jgi:hypothetical protein
MVVPLRTETRAEYLFLPRGIFHGVIARLATNGGRSDPKTIRLRPETFSDRLEATAVSFSPARRDD